eukprot:CAMPEP_0172492666 /NCGR_PEP_ID=MMETSP1066-20121228/23892_1 /TAXON_ID=671091 /ORGANISM="Coscinodiscus wailesii, Strain CCMP2513" /LENGTH=96 /DNA_ID=CAMNT_0013262423 /DNA_START=161 /DNA_END=451 /DNA_ORIENTATION=+
MSSNSEDEEEEEEEEEEEDDTTTTTTTDEIDELKQQCVAMARTLQKLQQDETELKAQNEILAREAVERGYPGMTLLKKKKGGGKQEVKGSSSSSAK